MSPACDNCGEHVSPHYHRVRKGNDGELHACPSCSSPANRERDAAGLSPYWGMVSCYDPDHDETLDDFDAIGHTWEIDMTKHWNGHLAHPSEADQFPDGLYEYHTSSLLRTTGATETLSSSSVPSFLRRRTFTAGMTSSRCWTTVLSQSASRRSLRIWTSTSRSNFSRSSLITSA
ncbi:hypothetical protein GOC77_18160 [Haloarcula argentinensis]|uniref:Small CPxCG-related zinc finger protein n=1 Tax=Haloarcula argentinensis TaxID=43776 RepID=A0A847URR2_HALAR|nr:hypothetical protein [Haloarcula argentinensis]